MRTLYFGGSFNPIHHGHLLCARSVAEAAGYDRVILIPNGQPPHKPDPVDMAPAADRLKMCELAVQGQPLFAVSAIEVHRDGRSYTLLTARELKRQGVSEVHWLIGADTVPNLPRWHQPVALLAEVHFVVMARPGYRFDWRTLDASLQPLEGRQVMIPQIDISSSQIRQRVAERRPIDYLTPRAVIEHIEQNGLYRKKKC